MPDRTDTFGFYVSGVFGLDISIGSYAQNSLDSPPADKVLRIDGVGDYIVPADAVIDADRQANAVGLSDNDKVRVFLRSILDAKFKRIG